MSDIRQYEAIAMLDLPDDEREFFNECLDEIQLGFAALESIDTEGAAPLVTALDARGVLREDIVIKSFTREEILANAPARHDGFFQVPGTI